MTDPKEIAGKLIPQLEARHFTAEYVATGAEAREAVLKRIPRGAAVMAGASTTLDQIGVTAALKDSGEWEYLRAKVWAENDPAKRQELRMRAMLAPFFLGSVAAITEDGILVAADNGGSRVAAYVAGPERVILVASVHKVVSDVHDAMRRVRDVATPMEQERVNRGPMKYESLPRKWVLLEGEPRPGRTHVVLVGEKLGF
jgi:L-lactate utilization protein LutC